MTGPWTTRSGDAPCTGCGSSDNIVWFTDDILWNQVMDAEPEMGRGAILCVECFVEATERSGIRPASWRLIPQYPVRRAANP